MNLRAASFLLTSSLALSLGLVVGCAADTSANPSTADGSGDETVADSEDGLSTQSNTGYFIVTHQDTRKCASPACGGFFVKRVNDATTSCADGTKQPECYVSAITLGGMGLSAREETEFLASVTAGKAIVKARTYKKTVGGQVLGTLKANEGWLGATGSSPDGTFYRAAANGIMCVKAPCPTTTAAELNGGGSHNVIRVDLDGTATPADPDALSRAQEALGTKEGILVVGGVALPKCMVGSTSCGAFVSASEFYLRVTRREGKACGSWSGLGCNEGQFCNWQPTDICGAADAPGVCAYRPQICYQLYKPVCGCDGKTYGNDCKAAAAGASVSSQGACTTK